MALELDAAALRERYGEPVARETFQVRPGLQMTVSLRARPSEFAIIEIPSRAN